MNIDITTELIFSTSRSEGKGGQNVNKLETKVEARWNIAASTFIDDKQKSLLQERLANDINKEGWLIAKSQTHRTQFANKKAVIQKIHNKITSALTVKKVRIATAIPKAIKQKRLVDKQQKQWIKQQRVKVNRSNMDL